MLTIMNQVLSIGSHWSRINKLHGKKEKFLSFNMKKELQQEDGRLYLTISKNHIKKGVTV